MDAKCCQNERYNNVEKSVFFKKRKKEKTNGMKKRWFFW